MRKSVLQSNKPMNEVKEEIYIDQMVNNRRMNRMKSQGKPSKETLNQKFRNLTLGRQLNEQSNGRINKVS